MVLCMAATARDSDESGTERHLRADGHEQQCCDAQCERASLSHLCGEEVTTPRVIAQKLKKFCGGRALVAVVVVKRQAATKNEWDGELGRQVQPPCVPAVLFACFVCARGMRSFVCP